MIHRENTGVRPTTMPTSKPRLEKKLAAYAVAGGALIGAAEEADAGIVFSPIDVTISSNGPTTSYTLTAGSTQIVDFESLH